MNYFYDPLHLTVSCSVLVSPEKYRDLVFFLEMSSGAVSAFSVRQRIHVHVRLRRRLEKVTDFFTCRWTSDPEVGSHLTLQTVFQCTRWCLPRSSFENVHVDAVLAVSVMSLMRWA